MILEEIKEHLLLQAIPLPERLNLALRYIFAACANLKGRSALTEEPKLYLYGDYLEQRVLHLITNLSTSTTIELRIGLEVNSIDAEGIKSFISNSFKVTPEIAGKIALTNNSLCFYFAGESYLINLFKPNEFLEELAIKLAPAQNNINLNFPNYCRSDVLNNGVIEKLLEENISQITSPPSEINTQKLEETSSESYSSNSQLAEAQHRKTAAKKISIISTETETKIEKPYVYEEPLNSDSKNIQKHTTEAQANVNKIKREKNLTNIKNKRPAPKHKPTTFGSPHFQTPPTIWQTIWNTVINTFKRCYNIGSRSYQKARHLIRPSSRSTHVRAEMVKQIKIYQGTYAAPIPLPQPFIAAEDFWETFKLLFQFCTDFEITAVIVDDSRCLPGQARIAHFILACLLTYYYKDPAGLSIDLTELLATTGGLALIDSLAVQIYSYIQSQHLPKKTISNKHLTKLKKNLPPHNPTSPKNRHSIFYQATEKFLTSSVSKDQASAATPPSLLWSYLRPNYLLRPSISYLFKLGFFELPTNEQLTTDGLLLLFWAGLNAVWDNELPTTIVRKIVEKLPPDLWDAITLLRNDLHMMEVGQRDNPSLQKPWQLRVAHLFLAKLPLWYMGFECTPLNLFLAAWALSICVDTPLSKQLASPIPLPKTIPQPHSTFFNFIYRVTRTARQDDSLAQHAERVAKPNSFLSYFRWEYFLQFSLLLPMSAVLLLRNTEPEQQQEMLEQIVMYCSFSLWINMVLDNNLGADRITEVTEPQEPPENRGAKIH